MVKEKYIPDRGDIVWINFNPTKGHEQSGIRPAFVISPKIYNKKSNLVLVCLITSVIKQYPFEVVVEIEEKKNAILTNQIRSVDWGKRKIEYISKAEWDVIYNVQEKLSKLIFHV